MRRLAVVGACAAGIACARAPAPKAAAAVASVDKWGCGSGSGYLRLDVATLPNSSGRPVEIAVTLASPRLGVATRLRGIEGETFEQCVAPADDYTVTVARPCDGRILTEVTPLRPVSARSATFEIAIPPHQLWCDQPPVRFYFP